MGEGAEATVWVSLDRMSGQPCIYGHRLPTLQVARMVKNYGIEFVRNGWPYLTDEQILGACWFEGVHGRSKKLRRWWRDDFTSPPTPTEETP